MDWEIGIHSCDCAAAAVAAAKIMERVFNIFHFTAIAFATCTRTTSLTLSPYIIALGLWRPQVTQSNVHNRKCEKTVYIRVLFSKQFIIEELARYGRSHPTPTKVNNANETERRRKKMCSN